LAQVSSKQRTRSGRAASRPTKGTSLPGELRRVRAPKEKTPAITAREAEILGLVARGYRTSEIADALEISARAVTSHLTRLMAKFEVPNRSGLIAAVMAAAGFGIPRSERAPLTRLGAQAHLATLDGSEGEQYMDAPFLVALTRGPQHIFVFVNRMWERVMGFSASDVVGKRVRELFPNAPRTSYDARQRAYRAGRPTTGTAWHFTWRLGDGTPRETDLRFIYQPVRNAAGRIEGLLLIATEETD
jgi:PAS domain S-box-containing protein